MTRNIIIVIVTAVLALAASQKLHAQTPPPALRGATPVTPAVPTAPVAPKVTPLPPGDPFGGASGNALPRTKPAPPRSVFDGEAVANTPVPMPPVRETPPGGNPRNPLTAEGTPFAPGGGFPVEASVPVGEPLILLTYEAFSLPIKQAAELQRKGLVDEALYKAILDGKQERLLSLRCKSGNRVQIENVTEYIYPTQYDAQAVEAGRGAGGTGPGVGGDAAPNDKPRVLVPSQFETRNVGDTFEAEAMLSEAGGTLDIQVAVSHSFHTGDNNWAVGNGAGAAKAPMFESQRISTSVVAPAGDVRFLGTLNPVFGNGIAKREQEIWFCFITATVTFHGAAAHAEAIPGTTGTGAPAPHPLPSRRRVVLPTPDGAAPSVPSLPEPVAPLEGQ